MIFFSLIRVIVFFVMFRTPSVLNAQASCLDRCCRIFNVSTFGRRVNSTTPMKEKKKTVRSMCVLNPNSFCSMKIYHLCPMITIEHTQTILNIYRYIYIREFSIAFSEPLFTGMPSFVFVLFFQCHLKSRLSVLLAI